MTDRRNDGQLTQGQIAQRRAARESLVEWWERLSERAAAWDLETVKHLIVLNAAGLAGVATLLAGSKPLYPGWVGPVALLGYGFGVAMAILNMYLASRSFMMMSDEIKRRIDKIYDPSASSDGSFEPLVSGRCINWLGQLCGWVAAILAMASTIAVSIGLIR
jgi:hypothetical protein